MCSKTKERRLFQESGGLSQESGGLFNFFLNL